MAENSSIQWTDHTFNPWIGCSKVHGGCANCYAEADMDKRRGRVAWGPQGTRSRTADSNWAKPIKWHNDVYEDVEAGLARRPRVFCCSLADVFEGWHGPMLNHKGEIILRPYLDRENTDEFRITDACVEDWWDNGQWQRHPDPQGWSPVTMADLRHDLFQLIDATPHLDWLLLTKRPENVRSMWPSKNMGLGPMNQDLAPATQEALANHDKALHDEVFHRHNVWIGTSVSDQKTADEMIPELLKCRDLAPVLFLSAEPLLGPVQLAVPWDGEMERPTLQVDWVIIGGESGPKARPCNIDWVRSLVSQCKAADVPPFVKQAGSHVTWGGSCGPREMWPHGTTIQDTGRGHFQVFLDHKKGGDPSEWPEDFRDVREFPKPELTALA